MKSPRFLLGLFALVALAACSSDSDLDVATNQSADGNTYMNVILTMSGGASTRADSDSSSGTNSASYESSTTAEATVSSAIFLFYDSSGTYVTYGTIDGGITWTTTTSSSTSAVYGTSTVTLSPSNTKPSQVLAVCNYSSSSYSNLIGKSLTEVLALTSSTLPSSAGSFIMTNAVLVDSSTDYFVRTTDITGTNVLYEKDSDGNAVDSDGESITASSVTINLERIVAKVKIGVGSSSSDGAITTTTTTDGTSTSSYSAVLPSSYNYRYVASESTSVTTVTAAKFKANVVGWGINCTNSSGYLLKHYKSSWQNQSTTMTTGQRSYWVDTNTYSFNWAEDANYDSDDVTDELTYTKWSTLNGSLSTDAGYYFENTACESAQSTYNQAGTAAVTPTVAVAATLQVSTDSGSSYADATDLYYSGGVYFTADAVLATALAEIATDAFYYSSDEGTTKSQLTLSQVTGCTFTSASSSSSSSNTGYVKIASITVADGVSIYSSSTTALTDYSDLVTALNATSYLSSTSSSGGLACFTGGACFYQTPIEHIVNSYDDNYCGLVRNHSYVITLNSISGVGSPVYDPTPDDDGNPGGGDDDDDDDEEDIVIIPGEDTTYYLDATVQLLNWVLHEQTVDF